MYDWLYSSHRCLMSRCLHWGIAHSSMMDFVRWQFMLNTLPRDYLTLRVYPFWEDAFILGHSYLTDFDIETWLSIYDCCFRWIIEMMIFLGSVFSAHLVWFDYPLTFVGHPNILPLIPLYLHLFCQSLAYLLLNPPILSSYMTLSPSFDQRRI